MALKLKAKPKKIVTRSQAKSIDDKYYGPEPVVIDVNNESQYRDALNWYNYMHEQDQAREWLLEHMKKSGFERAQIADVRRCPKHAVPTTIGWQARMMMNGNKLSESSMNFFNQRLDDLFRMATYIKDETEVAVEKPTVNIQDRVQAKIQQLITDCEEAVDNEPKLNIYEWLVGREATGQAATAIRDFYAKCVGDHEPDEFDDRAMKKARTEQKKYWEEFVLLVDRYINNKKAVKIRKPREKKVKSAVDIVKNLKFQKEDKALKIVSVHPAEIVGCNQLWVYNTKYKKLTQYISMSPQGLQIKGTTLTGWDPEQSVSKGLRKPDITIGELLKAGKVSLRSFMTDLKTTPSSPNGRINEQTILLRVIK